MFRRCGMRNPRQFSSLARVGLLEIVLVSHRERCIEVFARGDDGAWHRSEARAGHAAALTAIDATLEVDEVYRNALSDDWLA